MKENSATNMLNWPEPKHFTSGIPNRKRMGMDHPGDKSMASLKEQRASPEKPAPADRITPQFINITNSFSLSSNARASVRAQVMRDYHRRRMQKRAGQRSTSPVLNDGPALLSAKDQTHKFRFDGSKKEHSLGSGVRRIRKLAPRTAQIMRPHDEGLLMNTEPDDGQDLLRNGDEVQIGNEDAVGEGAHETLFDKVERLLSSMKISLRLPSLYNPVAPGVLDPFSAMSLLITPRIQLLLHHYFNVRLHTSWLMMPMRKGLFAIALHDEALFHTFMSHYVASYQLRYGKGDPAESLQHRTEAIRIVNKRLRDSSLALTDSTIAVVANLAIYESTNGSTESMRVHLKGLKEMIKLRGGIRYGGFTAQVRRLIAWTDFHCASALSEKPTFHPLKFSDSNIPTDPSFEAVSSELIESSTVYEDAELGKFIVGEHSLDWVLKLVQNLSTTLEVILTSSVLPEENVAYSDKVYYLQHCLLAIIHSPAYAQLDKVFAGSALIFCCACFRDVNFNFRVIADGVKRLRNELEALDTEYALRDSVSSARLFWSVTIGAIAAEGKAERPWFLEKMKTVSAVLNLGTWESAKVVLEDILWQAQLDQFGRRLWREKIYL